MEETSPANDPKVFLLLGELRAKADHTSDLLNRLLIESEELHKKFIEHESMETHLKGKAFVEGIMEWQMSVDKDLAERRKADLLKIEHDKDIKDLLDKIYRGIKVVAVGVLGAAVSQIARSILGG